MATPDYYNILGVKRSASQEEVKKAYRALAMRWHPDRNQADPKEAERRFKDISEAYHCLSDPVERARYDRLGPLYNPDGRPPRPEEVNDAVGTIWSSLFGRGRNARGEDLRYTISLSLEEVARGVEKEIVVPRRIRCRACGGDGADPDDGKRTCEACGGSGKSTTNRIFRSACYHCDGTGHVVVRRCAACGGDGRQTIEDSLRVKVPPGVGTGQKLKLAGKGDAPKGSGPEGDLFVIVNVSEHALFRRRGDDLLVEAPLTYAEITLGTDLLVPTLEGTTTIVVPPGTPPGRIFRLGKRGLPRVGKTQRGDLHVQIALEVPSGLNRAQAALLEAWASDLPPSAHPRRTAFAQAVEDR